MPDIDDSYSLPRKPSEEIAVDGKCQDAEAELMESLVRQVCGVERIERQRLCSKAGVGTTQSS